MRKYQKTHRKPKRAKAGVMAGMASMALAQNIWDLGRWTGENVFLLPKDKIPRPLLEIINDYASKAAARTGKFVIKKTKDGVLFTVNASVDASGKAISDIHKYIKTEALKFISGAQASAQVPDPRNALNDSWEDVGKYAYKHPRRASSKKSTKLNPKPKRARKSKPKSVYKQRPLRATVRRRKRTKKDKKGRTKKSKNTKKYTYAQRRLENAEQRLAIAKGINKKNVRKPLKLGDLNPDLLELIRDKLQGSHAKTLEEIRKAEEEGRKKEAEKMIADMYEEMYGPGPGSGPDDLGELYDDIMNDSDDS
uniref:Uncharacterized protein n=1 Tax=viral metagenome TaxID=1070528 RepID=A0A6C0F542_9ZZZZ|tara:strand:- start:2691 stop:3614 length:924 start_codon:yes stop_codon:yes gene_type:complete